MNRAGLPELVHWLCTCIRPIDNISFIKALDMNVFFRSKKDFVLTERNHRDFYENIKIYNRDFSHLLDLLMDSLHEDQEYPPMNTKEGVGILWVYLKKFPCDYGHAVWIDMPGDKKFKSFSEFLVDFMKVCQKHRTFSEATQKLSHVVSYRKGKGGRGNDYDAKPQEHSVPRRFDDQRPRRPDDRPSHRLSMLAGRKSSYELDEDAYQQYSNEEYYEEDVTPTDMVEYPPEDAVEDYQEVEPQRDPIDKRHWERSNEDEERAVDATLNAFMQGSNNFGPKPSFPSNRPPVHTGGPVPLRRPPPVPGVCFEALRSGSCESFKMGRCSYDHSAAALAAYCKKQQENMEAFIAKNPNSGAVSKPRA